MRCCSDEALANRQRMSAAASARFDATSWTWERIAAAYVSLVAKAMGRR